MISVYRFVRIPAATLGLLLLAAACSSGGTGGATGSPTPAAQQQLIVGAREDGYLLKGPNANVGQYPLNANIFEGLVAMDSDYNVVPVLATAWEFQAPNTWRFTLRQGVTFQDGQPFTAEAVKYTFDRIAGFGGGTPGIGKNSTKIIDDYTVEVTPKFKNRQLVAQLVHPLYSIIAPGSDPPTKPVGTGPFEFVSYDRQQQLVVKRFDGYWGPKAKLDQITFKFIPDPNARRLALEAGEVDLALEIPREAVADLEGKGFMIMNSPAGAYEAIYANIGGGNGYTILQDRAVRQAIEYSIDRDALIQGVFEGLAAPEQTMVPSRLLGDSASQIAGYSFDPEKAKQLLDDAGWAMGPDGVRAKDGQRLSLTLIDGFPSAQSHGSVPEFIQDQLKDVGIEIKIVKTPDEASYEDRLVSGEGDLWLEAGSQNDANPSFLPALLFWSVGLFGDIGYQPLFAPKGTFDGLIEQALASADSQEVKDLVAQAMQVLIDQEAVVIPLAGLFGIVAMTGNVQGFEPQPSGLQVRYDGAFMSA